MPRYTLDVSGVAITCTGVWDLSEESGWAGNLVLQLEPTQDTTSHVGFGVDVLLDDDDGAGSDAGADAAGEALPYAANMTACDIDLGFPADWLQLKPAGNESNELLLLIL